MKPYDVIKTTLAAILIATGTQAQALDLFHSRTKAPAVAQGTVEEDIMEISLEDNLRVPQVDAKQHDAVVAYMRRQANELVRQKYKVETMRNGEVLIATVNSDDLFQPNETELSALAAGRLRPFTKYLHNPDMYKVLLVMHSDDTGSEEYTDDLTEKRVFAVCDWFSANNADISQLVPYAMGASEPLVQNDTRANREINRRLEVYIVPGRMMIDLAKAGKLAQ